MSEETHHSSSTLKPADLRGILEYVPMFRGQVFVVSVDGSIVDDDNFANVVTDIAVLQNLHIRVVLVHGIGRQLKAMSQERGQPITDAYGSGPTDAATLALATKASGVVSQLVLQGLSRNGLKAALSNAVRSTEVGVLGGVDYRHTGKVDKIDLDLVRTLLEQDIVPVFSPICFDRDGQPLRVNSDTLATELAIRLKASKLIYLTPHDGLMINGQVEVNLPLETLRQTLRNAPQSIDPRLLSKARQVAIALENGVPRAHLLDGRVFSCLLTEIFDKVGLGSMVHANDYQQLRRARRRDAGNIFHMLRNAATRTEAVRFKSRDEVLANIDRFFVFEIDDSLIGCASLTPLGQGVAELGSVLVQPFYQGRGVGRKLVEYGQKLAAEQGYWRVIALSTQTAPFFREVCGFAAGSVEDLSPERRKVYEQNGRESKVFYKDIAARPQP